MQLAKNLYLWPQRSYLRKALEVPLAYLISAFWRKEVVMET
jgi:monofunctional biosynthetic peptidoglycan transglycosylase